MLNSDSEKDNVIVKGELDEKDEEGMNQLKRKIQKKYRNSKEIVHRELVYLLKERENDKNTVKIKKRKKKRGKKKSLKKEEEKSLKKEEEGRLNGMKQSREKKTMSEGLFWVMRTEEGARDDRAGKGCETKKGMRLRSKKARVEEGGKINALNKKIKLTKKILFGNKKADKDVVTGEKMKEKEPKKSQVNVEKLKRKKEKKKTITKTMG
jgi:hypothetical protein